MKTLLAILIALLVLLSGVACCDAFASLPTRSTSRTRPNRPTSTTSTGPLYFHESFVDWKPLSPDTFDEVTVNGCQIAKDEEYLEAILNEWRNDESGGGGGVVIESKPLEYKDGQTNLFGHLVRRRRRKDDVPEKSVPAILLFHTGTGPLDVALLHKASGLAQAFDHQDCVVLVCDIFSDPYGWGWNTPTTGIRSHHQDDVYEVLMADDGRVLRSRVVSAVNAMCDNLPEVDPQRLAGLGWDLGAQPILELARVNHSNQLQDFTVRALVTFYGTFHRGGGGDDVSSSAAKDDDNQSSSDGGTVLICNGKDDPFVLEEDLDVCTKFFESQGWTVDLQQYESAKHGFSNPAQAFNKDTEKFGYNKDADTKSWNAALQLLEKELFLLE